MDNVSGLQTGVYALVNKVNGKMYVGSAASSFASRMQQHCTKARRGVHNSRHFQRAWDKYGPKNFF